MTQEWTVFVLVGAAADDALVRFGKWRSARRTRDQTSVQTSDWHPSTRRAIANYVARLEEHRLQMPIVYYSRHADFWSMGDLMEQVFFSWRRHVSHDGGDLWCHRLPDKGRLVGRNKPLAAKAQFHETQWMARRMLEAARSFEPDWPAATLLVNRRVVGSSRGFEDETEAAARLPKWLSTPGSGKIDKDASMGAIGLSFKGEIK